MLNYVITTEKFSQNPVIAFRYWSSFPHDTAMGRCILYMCVISMMSVSMDDNSVKWSIMKWYFLHYNVLLCSKHKMEDWWNQVRERDPEHQSGLTLHDFRRTTDQIGCDMSRRFIAGNRGKWLTSGPLRCTISHYTTNFPQLRKISQFTAMSQIFLNMLKMLRRPAIPTDY